MERVVWWATLILFIILISLGLFILTATAASNPEAAAFILGFLGFWLFANRLIFGLGQIANLTSSFIEGKEIKKKEVAKKVAKNSGKANPKEFDELGIVTLLTMWRSSLEPFKYTYYLGFFLLFLFAVMFKLNIISSIVFGPIVEALTLGASIPTVLVLGAELLSDYYLSKALKKAAKESKEE